MATLSDDQNIVHTQSFLEKAMPEEPVYNKTIQDAVSNAPQLLSEEAFAKLLQNYQQSLANKFLNPYTFSIFGLYYAYKGSLGKIERLLLAGGALAALFFIIKNQEKKGVLTASALYDEYVKQVTPKGLING